MECRSIVRSLLEKLSVESASQILDIATLERACALLAEIKVGKEQTSEGFKSPRSSRGGRNPVCFEDVEESTLTKRERDVARVKLFSEFRNRTSVDTASTRSKILLAKLNFALVGILVSYASFRNAADVALTKMSRACSDALRESTLMKYP